MTLIKVPGKYLTIVRRLKKKAGSGSADPHDKLTASRMFHNPLEAVGCVPGSGHTPCEIFDPN